MKKFIKKITGESNYLNLLELYKEITDGHAVRSFSQEGEDLILQREFEEVKKGFYVDVGAYHPKRFSNTYLFYRAGWRGINIDARPGSMKSFNKIRPEDINIEISISDKPDEMIFYTFNEPAVSGFLQELSLERAKKEGYRIVKQEKMKSQKLSDVLDKYLPKGTDITFLSIDVEGLDFNVLMSNNWNKYLPKVILVEELSKTVAESDNSEISKFLYPKGYRLFAKTPNTSFFRKVE